MARRPAAAVPLDLVASLSKLEARPGEVVLVRCARVLEPPEAARLLEQVRELLPARVRAVLLDPGLELKALDLARLERTCLELRSASRVLDRVLRAVQQLEALARRS